MGQDIVIARPDTVTLAQEASGLIEKAEAVQVTNRDEHGVALTTIKEMRTQEKRITEHFEPARKALDVAKKEILTARDSLVKPLAETREVINRKATTYEGEQHRIAQEATRKAEAKAKKEEEIRLAEADRAIEKGDDDRALEILEAPVPLAPVTVEPKVAKVSGVSTRKQWSAEVFDKMALIQYVAKNEDWAFLVEPSMPALNRIAVSQKEAMDIPGVKATSTTVRTTR